MRKKLTGKQQLFVDAYIETRNATEAARRAGYKPKAAYATGSENLRKPQIKEAIDARLEEIDAAKKVSREELIQFFSSAIRGELTNEQIVFQKNEAGETAPSRMEVRIGTGDRLKAASEMLKLYTRTSAPPTAEEVKESGLMQLVRSLDAAHRERGQR